VSSQLFPDLIERIADFERRMAELQAEIDRLPEGRERSDALDAITEVARALAALKTARPDQPANPERRQGASLPPTVSRTR
jgi:transposase